MTVKEGKLRIVHVFRAPIGGLFRHVVDLAREQSARGHAVGVFCDLATGGDRAAQVLEALKPSLALGLVRVPMSRLPGLSDLRAVASARRYIRSVMPDVVHGHGSKGGLYARLPAFLDGASGPARAYTPHGGSFHYPAGSASHVLYMNVERLLAARTDIFLFESRYVADRFGAYVGVKMPARIVHNGIAEPEFEPIVHSDDAHDLVYIGELRALKGVDMLIEALALLRTRENRRVTLLVVGAGPDEDAFRAQAAALSLGADVTFAPPSPIRDVLTRGRVMVVPSRAESLPYVILEAAAAAQPLIATRVGGIPEIFGPQASRLIAPDDVERLAQAIAAMLDMPADNRAAQAAELREGIHERFSLKSMVDGVLAGYAEALAGRLGDPVKSSERLSA